MKTILASIAILIIAFIAWANWPSLNVGYIVLDNYPLSSTALTGVGSSTSLTMSTNNADKIALNITLTGTTTSEIDWVVYYSNDATTWYPEEDITETSVTVHTHGATALTHKWTPGTAYGTSYKRVFINNVVSKYTKVTFTAAGATSTLAVEGITQQTTN